MTKIRDELMALQESASDGLLRPATVVLWATDHPDSALHSSLEWDNDKAAHQHRLWQARKLIEIHIAYQSREPEVVSLSIDRIAGGGYRLMSDVIATPNLLEVMVNDALADLNRVTQKYQRIKELAGLFDEIKERSASVRAAMARQRAGETIPGGHGSPLFEFRDLGDTPS